MGKVREVNTNSNIRVVTNNLFITAVGLSKLSLKSRKLLYFAISQCEKNDKELHEYKISVTDFARLMGIAPTNVYQEADALTSELFGAFIYADLDGKGFDKYGLVSKCSYREHRYLSIKLCDDMMDFVLQLRGNFTQALLSDFMKMRSPYSMAVWHLMQREMKSKKPGSRRIDFYLSLDELRLVTGTEKKFVKLSHFKDKVLDKALLEIQEHCGTIITYKNRKQGRTVIGFDFCAINEYGIDMAEYKPTAAVQEKGRWIELKRISRERVLDSSEQKELEGLNCKYQQV